MTDFDRGSLDRVLPAPAGPADWDDVMSRLRTHRSNRRRRLVMLAAAALVAVVGTASAIGSVREFILDRGFIGLPPEGATPSTPESGELVVHYLGKSMTYVRGETSPTVEVWVYADGRMIWTREGRVAEGATELVAGYLEQRLTPEGVELLQSEVAELLERSSAPLETLPADYDPLAEMRAGRWGRWALFVAEPQFSWGFGSVEVRDGDRLLGLKWLGTRRNGGIPPESEGTIATPEQLADLRRLDALLTDPASVLPASAWAVRKVRAYVASHYEVCMGTSPPKDVSELLSLLPAQAADVLRGTSLQEFEGDLAGGVTGRYATHCAKLTTEEAREVAEALSGLDPRPAGARLAYQLEPEGPTWSGGTQIWFEPYFPHGQVTCSACG